MTKILIFCKLLNKIITIKILEDGLIFGVEIKDDNIVVFPNGNWVTNLMYYNSQKGQYKLLKDEVISDDYILLNNEYAEKLLDVSNKAIVFDLFNPNSEEEAVSKNN